MSNKPFISQSTNILNENKYNSVPGNIGIDAVLITQSSNRRVIDQKSLTITKNDCQPFLHYNYASSNSTQPHPQTNNLLHAQKEYFPGGITFSFNQLGQTYQQHLRSNNQQTIPTIPNGMITSQYLLPQQPSLTLEQQIALKQLEKEGLELTLMKERLQKNPYQLTFHQDSKTSTSDLLNAINQIPTSQGLYDFKNVCSEHADLKRIVEEGSKQIKQCDDPACLYSSKKKLVLTKTSDLQKQASSIEVQVQEVENDDDDNDEDDTISDNSQHVLNDSDSEDSNNNSRKTKNKKRKRTCKQENSFEDKYKRKKNTKTRKRTHSEESLNYRKKRKTCKTDKPKQKRKNTRKKS
ncbi:hypothetical protein RN001_011751 [Aquatica leii]|uniref:Uncharacterized protein n=1 Tax=Aquatica leii TaxID=1421715 RepID=A0AAN7PS58_9COLE|nr:hypothetical protein RN001_011751 [Aquatica leii]